MAEVITKEHVLAFIGGFIIGKLIGAAVSILPLWSILLQDSSLFNFIMEEYYLQILSYNIFHLILGLIGALILAILADNRRISME